MRSEAPLVLRPTIGTGEEPGVFGDPDAARVTIAAGAGGPVGGDRLELSVVVGPGSTLVLCEASATLLLPGRDGATSSTEVRIEVGDGGTFVWLPEPVIAARGCDHVIDVRVELGEDAQLLAREEVLLGRHGEAPGRLRTRWRVNGPGGPVLAQDLELGTTVARTAAVVGPHRAVGSVVAVTPNWITDSTRSATLLTDTAAILPMAKGAVMVSVLADDSIALRNAVAAGIATLGPPWTRQRPTTDPDPDPR